MRLALRWYRNGANVQIPGLGGVVMVSQRRELKGGEGALRWYRNGGNVEDGEVIELFRL